MMEMGQTVGAVIGVLVCGVLAVISIVLQRGRRMACVIGILAVAIAVAAGPLGHRAMERVRSEHHLTERD